MHHLLTFTLNLNQPEKWQPICSEIRYGTHYLIYAKFIPKENQLNPEKCDIGEIKLWLQNFTGAVTLGIADASVPEWGETRDGFEEMHILKIKIKPLFYNPNFDIEITDDLPLIFDKNGGIETIVSTERTENSSFMDTTNEDTRREAIFVDEEHYIRDGEDIHELEGERGSRNCRAIRGTVFF